MELDLMHLVVRLMRGYRLVIGLALAAFLISVPVALLLKKSYTSRAVFLPPVNLESAQSASLFARQDPTDLYLGMLASRSVADSVIDEAHLMDVYHAHLRSEAVNVLAAQSKFAVEKDALISVNITTDDPNLSAQIGNAYLNALYKLNGQMSASASMHRREFFEAQLANEKESLAQAELSMKQMEERNGTVLPEGEAQAGVSATAHLQADIQSAEARLSSLLTGSTEQNPQVVALRAEIGEMRAQQERQASSRTPGSGLPSSARMPGVMLDYLRASRDLKERETLYDSLTQQYEKARLASLDPGPQLQVVDHALVPEHKSGPPRTLIVAGSTVAGAILGLLIVFLTDPLRIFFARYTAAAAKVPRR
jgi:tyrosine-protein kinase Etk/Wzc